MKEKKAYSKLIQAVSDWDAFKKGHIIALLDHCVEHNISSFDNADFSGKKYADHIFGVALSETGFEREEIQLISKYCPSQNPESNLVETIDDQLLRLKTDYLDLILLEPIHQLPKLMDEVAQLMSQGKIKEIGGMNLQRNQVARLEKHFPVRANQIKFSQMSIATERRLKPSELEGAGSFVWYFPEKSTEETEKNLNRIGAKYSCDKNELILAWLLSHPSQLHPVIHFSEAEKITEAAKLRDLHLDPVDWQKIEALLAP